MGRIRGKGPSPALVVSIIALVFAVAGTAVAGVATISVLSKKEKKQTRKIAKSEIKKAAPGLSVASADSANKLDGLDADGLIRTAFSSVADAPDANGTVLTTTIQAPGSGFLTIIASLDVVYGPGDDQLECLLQTDEANIPNSLRGLNVAGTVNADTDCVPTITRQVGAGAHKVDLEVTNRNDATFGAGSLTVIFTPFNATGGTA